MKCSAVRLDGEKRGNSGFETFQQDFPAAIQCTASSSQSQVNRCRLKDLFYAALLWINTVADWRTEPVKHLLAGGGGDPSKTHSEFRNRYRTNLERISREENIMNNYGDHIDSYLQFRSNRNGEARTRSLTLFTRAPMKSVHDGRERVVW